MGDAKESVSEQVELQTVKVEPPGTDESHAAGTNCVFNCVNQRPVNINKLKTLVRSPSNVNFVNDKDKKTALHVAVWNKEADVVDVLLGAGAEIKQDVDGNTALHYAVTLQAFDIFKRLLPPRQTIRQNCGDGKKLLTTDRSNHITRTKTDYYIHMATSVNNEGFNVLDLALDDLTDDKRKMVEYIVLETDIDCVLRLLRNKTEKKFNSPFRGLIKKMPEIAKEVMDKCITRKRNEITFHYEMLDDTYFLEEWPPDYDDYPHTWEHRLLKDTKTLKEYTNSIHELKNNHPLNLMIRGKRTDIINDGIYLQLLDHPLVKALVRRKWSHIGVKFHFMLLVWYMIYLGALTFCVNSTVPTYTNSQNTTACQNVTVCQTETCYSFESSLKSISVVVQKIVAILCVIMLLGQIYQMSRVYRLNYIKSTNYVDTAIHICSFLFVLNIEDCKAEWQWVLGVCSVFMAWINLLTFAKKFDCLGVYVMMTWSITKTFIVLVFPIVAVLLIAFAVAFKSLHQDQVKFANVWHSILMTTSLMKSGFDYEQFLSLVKNDDLFYVSYSLYIMFQLLMAIVMINLALAVAVRNVQEIHKDACSMNTVLQIEYTLELEGHICFICSKLRNICGIKKFRKWFVLKPNETIVLTQLKSKRLPVQQILDLTDKKKAKDEQDGFQEGMNTIMKQMSELNSTIKDTNERMNTVETKLNELSSIKLNKELRDINAVLELQSKVIVSLSLIGGAATTERISNDVHQ